VTGLLLFLALLAQPAFAVDAFYRCLAALKAETSSTPAAEYVVTPFKFQTLSMDFPPQVIPYAKYIAADDSLNTGDKIIMLLTLEEMFGPDPHSVAGTPMNSELQSKLNLILNIPKSAASPTRPTEAVYITHQQNTMQDASAELISEGGPLHGVHTTLLATGHFPIRSKALIENADTFQHSEGGEIEFIPPQVTRFHLMGGHCNYCLSQSISSIVAIKLMENSREPIDIYIYSSQSYILSNKGHIITAAQALQEFQKRASTLISDIVVESDLPRSARVGKGDYVESDTNPSYRIPITGTHRPVNIHVLPQ